MSAPVAPSGIEIRSWRKANALTQEQAARRLGVTLRTVQAWEAGDAAPPPYLRSALDEITREQEAT